MSSRRPRALKSRLRWGNSALFVLVLVLVLEIVVPVDHEQEHEHDYEIRASRVDRQSGNLATKSAPSMRRSPFALFASLLLATTLAGDPPKAPETAGIISHIKREAVQSTALASVGYSKRLHALEIEFRNGAIYRYLDVDASVYHDLMNAPSKARFYDENIRGKYQRLRVRRKAE